MTAPPRRPPQFGLAGLLWMMFVVGALLVAWKGGLLAWDEGLLPQLVVIVLVFLALPALAAMLKNR